MPPPRPLPCGGAGQMACPPEPTVTAQINALMYLAWYRSLKVEHQWLVDTAVDAWMAKAHPTE